MGGLEPGLLVMVDVLEDVVGDLVCLLYEWNGFFPSRETLKTNTGMVIIDSLKPYLSII